MKMQVYHQLVAQKSLTREHLQVTGVLGHMQLLLLARAVYSNMTVAIDKKLNCNELLWLDTEELAILHMQAKERTQLQYSKHRYPRPMMYAEHSDTSAETLRVAGRRDQPPAILMEDNWLPILTAMSVLTTIGIGSRTWPGLTGQ